MDELQALAIAIARSTKREVILENHIEALEGQNKELVAKLDEANKRIAELTPKETPE